MADSPDGTPGLDPAGELVRLRTELAEALEKLAAAERAAARRDEVLGTLVHDIRTPLSSLVVHADMLQRTLGPEHPGRRRVETILTNAHRVAAMIHELVRAPVPRT